MTGVVAVCLMVAVALGGDPTFEEMASRFREYRVELRREESREERPELRAWDGPVHALMSDLGRRIEKERLDSDRLIELLGEPDETIRAGAYHDGAPVPRGQAHLVYWWRGGHDYLYFVVRRGRVVESRWWYAGE